MSILTKNTFGGKRKILSERALIALSGILIALFVGSFIGLLPVKVSAIISVILIGIPILLLGFIRLDVGILFLLAIGFFIELFNKYGNVPFGVLMDGLIVLFGISTIAQLAKKKNFDSFKHPISYMILVWIYYCGLQLFNPWAQSQLAWLFSVRAMAGTLLLFYVAVYSLDSIRKIKNTIIAILFFGFLAALYGLKQEYLGFTPTEMAWLHADETRFQLIFQWSRLRVFSFFSDPTTCGVLLGYLFVLGFALLFGPYKTWKKFFIGVAMLCMLLTIGYAGSRTPIAMLPAGFIFLIILNPRKDVLLIFGFVFMFGTLGMMKSSGNPVIHRIQSAFKPSEDASVQVRLDNQALIQPMIHRLPIGAGLGSSGLWGKRFTPDTFLANFAHDSGFVRIAVEMGWIGLILYMTLLMVIMYTGIRQFFNVKNEVIKNLTLSILVALFCMIVASYPQEVIPMMPTNIIFSLLLACLVNLGKIDKKLQLEKNSTLHVEPNPS